MKIALITKEANFFEISGRLKNRVKLPCLTGEGNLGLVQNIGNLKKTPRVREIVILLYFTDCSEQ